MWVYGLVLVGVTVVVLVQLNRLRHHRLPELAPERLAALADERQAIADDALARCSDPPSGLRITHESAYGWPAFTLHVADAEAAQALRDSGTLDRLRAAFVDAVTAARGPAVEGVAFDPVLGVVLAVDDR